MINNYSYQLWKEPAADNSLTVVAMQINISLKLSERIERALFLLEEAQRIHGPSIFLLPEYCLMDFHEKWQDTVAMADTIPGELTKPFEDFAGRAGSYVVVGMLEKSEDPERPYNAAAVLGPEGAIGSYRKVHLWDSGNEEKKRSSEEFLLFTQGDELPLFEMFGHKVGIMICADGTFPEVPRILALQGAELLLYPNGRGPVGPEAHSMAKSNLLPVVISNPIGRNGEGHGYDGSSRIISPWGTTLASAVGQGFSPNGVARGEGWAAAELDMKAIAKYKTRYYERTGYRADLYQRYSKYIGGDAIETDNNEHI